MNKEQLLKIVLGLSEEALSEMFAAWLNLPKKTAVKTALKAEDKAPAPSYTSSKTNRGEYKKVRLVSKNGSSYDSISSAAKAAGSPPTTLRTSLFRKGFCYVNGRKYYREDGVNFQVQEEVSEQLGQPNHILMNID